MAANVCVAVRFRPHKGKRGKAITHADAKGLVIRNPKDGKTNEFFYDHCFNSADSKDPNYVSQEHLFDKLGKKVLDCTFGGLNSTVFAYGQSGSGKTYTMMGNPDTDGEAGFIPRLCEALFTRIREPKDSNITYHVEASFCEIYNERVMDLLRPGKYKNLRVREHKRLGPYVEGLTVLAVDDVEAVQTVITDGNRVRAVAATKLNERSSRSHAVLTLVVRERIHDEVTGVSGETVAKINLVDLAGSERQAKTEAMGMRLKEAGYTNKSLLTLGMVIHALAAQGETAKGRRPSPLNPRSERGREGRRQSRASVGSAAALQQNARRSRSGSPALRDVSKRARSSSPAVRGSGQFSNNAFVPYRDSVLTWLLKESLGGNSSTIMIATISSSTADYEETMSTLRYADRAKHIVNSPVVNEDETAAIVRELREEIADLKHQLETGTNPDGEQHSNEDMLLLQEQLAEAERLIREMSMTWEERLARSRRELEEAQLNAEAAAREAEATRAALDARLRQVEQERDRAEQEKLEMARLLEEEKQQRLEAEQRHAARESMSIGTDAPPSPSPPPAASPPRSPSPLPSPSQSPSPSPSPSNASNDSQQLRDEEELRRLAAEADRARAEAEANRKRLEALQADMRDREEQERVRRERVALRKQALRCMVDGQASKEDFEQADLKQHVLEEMGLAGAAREVLLDQHTCRGWCEKRSHHLKVWKKRWCELDLRTGRLSFFAGREGSELSHVVLTAINKAVVDHDQQGSQLNSFFVMTHERTYRFRAPSPQALKVWCTAFNALVKEEV